MRIHNTKHVRIAASPGACQALPNLKKLLAALLFILITGSMPAAEGSITRRFGIFIGANNGGRDRIMLRYAVSDAKELARVFTGMGGIATEDQITLVEPSVAEINRHLDNLGRLAAQAGGNSQRTELVFYYSGHSDEDGIILNRERYSYRDLRERINTVQTDMKIVILDSCSSGAITRAKGGVKTQPFLFDSSVSTEGFAFLTSSSDNEVSQESDSIGSSYFTHSLLAGLRGAADSVGDGRVTLNELYRYAYTETLARTEASTYGAQHPSFDIQISGSGDVVMTDIREISASLFFAGELSGRLSIRDRRGFLVAELTKPDRRQVELGLEPGFYRITIQQDNNLYRADIVIPGNQRTSIDMKNFSAVASAGGDRRRGIYENVPVYPLNIQFWPGYDILGRGRERATNNFLFGLFAGMGYSIRGVQISGGFNTAEDLRGLQLGLININEYGAGCMAGLVNISGSENIVPLGLVNIMKNGIIHGAVYTDEMLFLNAGFRSGSRYFYSFFGFGLGNGYSYRRLDIPKEGRNIPISARLGIGLEIPVKNFFFDLDVSAGGIFVSGKERYGSGEELASYIVPLGQMRLIFGYKIFEHMGFFTGLTYGIYNLPLIPDKRAGDYNVKSGNYFSGRWGFVGGIQF